MSSGGGDVKATKLNIDDAIDRIGSGWFQVKLLLATGFCLVADSGEILVLSFLSTVVQALWQLTNNQTALLTASVFAGQLVGKVIMGPMGDACGRKPTLIITTAIVSVFGFLTAAAQNYWELVALRFLVGVGCGGVSVAFDALSEFLPHGTRGRLMVLTGYFWSVGQVFIVALAYWTVGTEGDLESNPNGWRYLVIACTIPVALSAFFALYVIPESPRWYLARGHHDRAVETIRRAAAGNGKDPLEAIPEGVYVTEGKEQERRDFKLLLVEPVWRRTTLLIWISRLGMGFAYWGIVQINTNMFSSKSEQLDNDDDAVVQDNAPPDPEYYFEYTPILIASLAEFVAVTLNLFIIDSIGRRPTQVVAFGCAAVFVMIMVAIPDNNASDQAALVTFAFFSRMAIRAGGSISHVAVPELFPTGLRSTGHASAGFMGRVGGFLSPFVVERLAFWETGIILMVALLTIATSIAFLPETKDKPFGTAGGRAVTENNGGDGDTVAADDAREVLSELQESKHGSLT